MTISSLQINLNSEVMKLEDNTLMNFKCQYCHNERSVLCFPQCNHPCCLQCFFKAFDGQSYQCLDWVHIRSKKISVVIVNCRAHEQSFSSEWNRSNLVLITPLVKVEVDVSEVFLSYAQNDKSQTESIINILAEARCATHDQNMEYPVSSPTKSNSLKLRLKLMTRKTEFKCDSCSVKFANRLDLDSHVMQCCGTIKVDDKERIDKSELKGIQSERDYQSDVKGDNRCKYCNNDQKDDASHYQCYEHQIQLRDAKIEEQNSKIFQLEKKLLEMEQDFAKLNRVVL